MIRTQSILRRICYALFSVLFIWTCYHVIFVPIPISGPLSEYIFINTFFLLLQVIIVCALLFFVFKSLSSVESISEKKGRLILIAFMAVSSVISIILGFELRYQPMWDLGAVFYGGIEWSQTGDFQSYHRYFVTFPHNIPTLLLFRAIFTVYGLFGIDRYHFAVMVIFTVVLLQVSVYLIYDSIRRLMDIRAAVMALFVIAIYLPFYTMGAAFYTDVLSLPFIALAFNLYLRIKAAESFKHKLVYAALFGVTIGIGALIKTTVLILFIACLIDWVVNNKDWKLINIKSNALLFGTATLIIVVVMIPYNIVINHLFEDQLFKHRIPTTAHILVGLDEESGGAYTWETAQLYYSLENVDARQAEIKRLIDHRINELGTIGLIRHAGIKLGVAFRSGTFDQAHLIGANYLSWVFLNGPEPENKTDLYETLLPGGRYYPVYNHMTTAVMLGLLIFSIASALIRLFISRLRDPESQLNAPWIAFIGLAVFLMIFETGNRLPTNFFPLMVICAVQGLYDIQMCLDSAKKEKSGSESSEDGA